jgi:hypothetical protein
MPDADQDEVPRESPPPAARPGGARRDRIWYVPAIVSSTLMAVPGALTTFTAGVLYTFGEDSCGPGTSSGRPCPDQVSSPWLAEWGVALAVWCLTLAPPWQTRLRALRWLVAAAAVALAWLGFQAVGSWSRTVTG